MIDQTRDAVSHNKGKPPLLSTDDLVQTDAKLEHKQIEAHVLLSVPLLHPVNNLEMKILPVPSSTNSANLNPKSLETSNQDVFLEAVVLAQLVENGASNVSLARVPQTSSLDNDDIEGTDGGEEKHGTVFLDPEPQAIDVWPKELQQLEHDVKHPRVKLQARELPPPDLDYNAAHLLEAKTQPQDFKGVSEALQPFDGEAKHCQPLGEDAMFQPVEDEERELQLPDGEVRDLQLPENDDKPQPMGCKSTELPVSNNEGKKLQSLDGLVQELKPLDVKTRDLGPLESKTQVDLESADKFGRTKNLQPPFFARWKLTLIAESGQNPRHQEAAGIYSVSYADILKRRLNLNDDEEPGSGATHLELPQILDTTSVEDSSLPDWPDTVERGLRDA
ncbi:hypothetical protein Nepgr_033260 [Nepenthes gracilis]|uniref:Uncharacterized protein n=1 Tax=Nepenthes gracilis TaxID=150966 RepID=A0AAD3TL34_NEPGR|nr:hypothetical protein Nepgr_033260 [Nepenthes gracilis]